MNVNNWLKEYLKDRTVSTKILFKDAKTEGFSRSTVIKALDELDCSIVRNNSSGKDFFWCLNHGVKRWVVVDCMPIIGSEDFHMEAEQALEERGYREVVPDNGTPLPRTWFMDNAVWYWTEEG